MKSFNIKIRYPVENIRHLRKKHFTDKVFTGIIARLQWPIDNVVTDEVWAYHIATIGDAMRDRKV